MLYEKNSNLVQINLRRVKVGILFVLSCFSQVWFNDDMFKEEFIDLASDEVFQALRRRFLSRMQEDNLAFS